LCRECHDWVHANGRDARKLGWIIDIVHALPNPDQEP
jgi:hypothetical protein